MLRAPSIDQGVQSFVWAVVFFIILWLGMLAVGVSGGTALIIQAGQQHAAGEDRPGPVP